MVYAKDEITEQIVSVLTAAGGKVNPSVIMQKLKWNKDAINEICTLFETQKFSEVLKQIPEIEMQKDEHGTVYAQIVHNDNTNATTEENMAENNTKSQNRHDRIMALRDALTDGLYEKDEAVRLALLTAIAGESIFFLGAPGCAKSMIARRVVQAFKADGDAGVKYFETLLNQFSTPEEVFGNISLKALNGELEGQNGKEEYRRLTENMLPEADIAFLDEIWKASPAILNTLLTIINERKFHNGGKVEDVPLKALFAASNELPAKGRGLEALYDRFILRLCVGYIQNEDEFFDMISGSSSADFSLPEEVKALQITNDELNEWKTQIDKIELSDEAKAVISAIRKEMTARNQKLTEENKDAKNDDWQRELFEVGDRRWKKIAHILKASAFLNDRTTVDLMDCQLIEYCIWSTEKQHEQARDIVEKCIKQNGVDCDTAIEDINEQIEGFNGYITEQFYIDNPDYKKLVMEKIGGRNCYEVDYENEKCWINSSLIMNHSDNSKITDVTSFQVDEQNLTIDCQVIENGRWVQKKFNAYYCSQAKMKDSKVFDTQDLLELRQHKANSEHYSVIKNNINSEIKKLDDFAAEKSAPYKANLFADQHYCDVIMNAVMEAKNALQDAQVDLDKKRARYQS